MSDTPEQVDDFADAGAAGTAAQAAIEQARIGPDDIGVGDGRPGTPVLVRTTSGAASYWLVPLVDDGRPVGFVRVTGSGSVAAIGRYGGSSALDLDSDGALDVVSGRLADGETVTDPMLVHDGPPGREAWMLVTGGPRARLIFVTPAGHYERPADDETPTDVE